VPSEEGKGVDTEIKGLGDLIKKQEQQQPPVAQEKPRQTPPKDVPPGGLFTAFVQLNAALRDAIDGVRNGKLSGDELYHAILYIELKKQDLINTYFAGETLFGVPANTVILDLDHVVALVVHARHRGESDPRAAVSDLQSAMAVKNELEKKFTDLAHQGGTPKYGPQERKE